MADEFTEVTSEGWLSRLGGAVKGILIGLVMFAVSFVLLFWNEGRAVKRAKTLKEGGNAVVSVAADEVHQELEGKLIHLTGRAETKETLKDEDFDVSAAGALRLQRRVEMYQWKESQESETKKKLGGGTETVTTYVYRKEWSSGPIDSTQFKEPAGHENPGALPYPSKHWNAKEVTLGAFRLSQSLLERITDYERLPLEPGAGGTAEKAEAEAPVAAVGDATAAASGETVGGVVIESGPLATGGGAGAAEAVPAEQAGDATGAAPSQGARKVYQGYLYLAANPASPGVGDARISFEQVAATDVSLVAKQAGKSFEPYQTAAGGSIQMLKIGEVSADEMFSQAVAGNKMLTWILRGAGFLIMGIGIGLVLRPLSVVADVLPIAGNIVGAGTNFVAFAVAAILSVITVAVAWIFYRPVLGVSLLAGAGGIAFLLIRKMRAAGKARSRIVDIAGTDVSGSSGGAGGPPPAMGG